MVHLLAGGWVERLAPQLTQPMNRNIKNHIEKRTIKVASPGQTILAPTSVLPAKPKKGAAESQEEIVRPARLINNYRHW